MIDGRDDGKMIDSGDECIIIDADDECIIIDDSDEVSVRSIAHILLLLSLLLLVQLSG